MSYNKFYIFAIVFIAIAILFCFVLDIWIPNHIAIWIGLGFAALGAFSLFVYFKYGK